MSDATDIVLAYVTAGSRDEALSIGRKLVEERLATCVNVLDGMTSVYRWRGTLEESNEAILIAKTRRDGFDRLAARVTELHSYDLPCVITLPVDAGLPAYLDWVRGGVD